MNNVHNKLDLNLFRIMVAIAEEGSTIAAAARLHLSQSAISHALRRLREVMDDPIFVKHGRHLVLTPYGRNIFPIAKQSIHALLDCSTKAVAFDPLKSRLDFNFGFRDILEFYFLPAIIAPLRKRHAQMKFSSHRIQLSELEEKLLNGSLDIVIDLETLTSTKIDSEEISRETLCILVGEQHPCFDKQEISQAEFSQSGHVLVSLNRRDYAYIDSRIRTAGVRREIVLQCEHYLAALKTVEESDLLLTMPERFAKMFLPFFNLKLLTFPFKYDALPIRMYWRKETGNEAYMIWLRETLRTVLTKPNLH